jgi:hypothetical protein
MTMIVPGEEPIGYTYKAENYPASQIIEALEQGSTGLHFPAVSYDSYTPEGMLQRLAFLNEIEYDDPRSYDSDDFPKPIFADQLACTDDWAGDAKPGHYWLPWMATAKDQTCGFCGVARTEIEHG